jgi:hypothetical protein
LAEGWQTEAETVSEAWTARDGARARAKANIVGMKDSKRKHEIGGKSNIYVSKVGKFRCSVYSKYEMTSEAIHTSQVESGQNEG